MLSLKKLVLLKGIILKEIELDETKTFLTETINLLLLACFLQFSITIKEK